MAEVLMARRPLFRVVGLAVLLLAGGCARNLADQLMSADEGRRQAALRKLDAAGPVLRRDVLPYLLERLSSANGNVRRRAVQALTAYGVEAVGPLVKSLGAPDPKVRAAAAEILGHLGGDAKSALGPLVAAEEDENAEVRTWAAVSLNRIKAVMSPAELKFFRVVYGGRESTAPEAAKPADLPSDDPAGLVQSLKRAGARARAETVAALVGKGPLAVPALLKGVSDPDEGVRDGAAEALRLLALDRPKAAAAAPTAAQAALAARLAAQWSEMAALLARRQVEPALAHIEESRRDSYRKAFLSLGDDLPAVARGLSVPLSFRGAAQGEMTLEGRADVEGVQQTVEVLFVADDKGAWKIRAF
jgi:HEAT repeat protein